MAELTDAQKKRQEARKRRRGKDDEPQAEDGSSEQQSDQPLDAVVNAAKIAAAGAAVGAAAAAAKVLASRRDGEGDAAEPVKDDQPQKEQAAAEEPEMQAHEEPEEEDRRQQQPPQRQQQEPEREEPQEPVEGAPIGDAQRVAQRAREELEELLGKPVESMAGLERTHDGWLVLLEVVELSRIPESTDVLASYELELDDDLNFRRYQQARRYTRSQADRGDDS